MTDATRTRTLAAFIAGFRSDAMPSPVAQYTRTLVRDGVATLVAATHPRISTGSRISRLALGYGGPEESSLIGAGARVAAVNAVLANGTLGYACDLEPHHPEGVLHPIAIMVPTALALAEAEGRCGRDLLAAVALGCEVEYRVSMALGPKQLYALGFHPSAVCGTFGAAAAACYLLRLDGAASVRALGLAACQASGLMAWEDDPTENARPFQMGMAARNGVTAAQLARLEFGGPDRIFDGGHTMFRAFSRDPRPEWLLDGLGERWDGVTKLAIKPYSCVSFLHPSLDALSALVAEHDLASHHVASIRLRFPASGAHCIDSNPLKSHCAQYVLPVALGRGRLEVLDLFEDRREDDEEVARLSKATTVERDEDELERLFPDLYASELTLELRDGRRVTRRSDIARGYPQSPLSEEKLTEKFCKLVDSVASLSRRRALQASLDGLEDAANVSEFASLLREPFDADIGDQ